MFETYSAPYYINALQNQFKNIANSWNKSFDILSEEAKKDNCTQLILITFFLAK